MLSEPRCALHLGRLALVLAFITSLVSGCGTGGGILGSTNVPGGTGLSAWSPGGSTTGNLKVELIFPSDTAKTVDAIAVTFANTETVIVHVIDPATRREVAPPVTAQRPAGAQSMNIIIPGLAPGTYDVFVQCFDAQGNSAGYSVPSATVVANETVTVQVTGTVTITNFVVTPATATISVGATQQFTATATFSNNTSRDVTLLSTWTANDALAKSAGASAYASIGSTTGLASGTADGVSQITATLDASSGTAMLTVTGTTPTPTPTPTPDPYFYAYDSTNSRVMMFDDTHTFFQAYGTSGTPTTQGQFGYLTNVMRDQGKIYAMSYTGTHPNYTYYVTQMDDMQGNGWTTFEVPSSIASLRPAGMVACNGKVYLFKGDFDLQTTKVWQFDAGTGANMVELDASEAGFWGQALWVREGKIYLAMTSTTAGTPHLTRFDSIAGGTPTTWTAPATTSNNWVTLDSLGRIYWADFNNNRIFRVDDMTGANQIDLVIPGLNPYEVQVNGFFHLCIYGQTKSQLLYFADDIAGTNVHTDFGTAGTGDWQTGSGAAPQWGLP